MTERQKQIITGRLEKIEARLRDLETRSADAVLKQQSQLSAMRRLKREAASVVRAFELQYRTHRRQL